MTLVTAIVPMYNAAETVERAISSIKAQAYPDIEIIIIDDGSTDDSLTIAQNISGVTCLRTPVNRGASAARNIGIAHARGDYIAFLDADDVWLPEKIARQMKLMKESSLNPALVSCNITGMYSDGTVKTPNYYKEYMPVRGERIWTSLLVRDFIFTPTVLLKKQAIQSVGMFDEQLTICEDWDLWIRITRKYPFDYCPEVLTHVYEERSGSLMDGHRQNLAWIPLTIEHILHQYGNDPNYPIPPEQKREIFGEAYLQYGYCYFVEGQRQNAHHYFLKTLKTGHRKIKVLSLLLRNLLRLK